MGQETSNSLDVLLAQAQGQLFDAQMMMRGCAAVAATAELRLDWTLVLRVFAGIRRALKPAAATGKYVAAQLDITFSQRETGCCKASKTVRWLLRPVSSFDSKLPYNRGSCEMPASASLIL